MSRILILTCLQEPFDLGLDANDRAQFSFNIIATKTQSTTWAEEVTALLVNGGVGVYNTNIFRSSKAVIPTGAGPYLTIIETGGVAGVKIHNQLAPAYPRPAARIVVRASTVAAARAMAWAAHTVLAGVSNLTVTP
jgi:hypothetical protein